MLQPLQANGSYGSVNKRILDVSTDLNYYIKRHFDPIAYAF